METFEAFWHYHSEAPTNWQEKFASLNPCDEPSRLFIPHGGSVFEIAYETQSLRPNYLVTLRTDVTGWEREIRGTYWYGAWRFCLPRNLFESGCHFRFVLNNVAPQLDGDFSLPYPQRTSFSEGQVRFPAVPPRFIHGYENLRVVEDEQQQNVLPTDYSESSDWDVIVIGSGMGGGILADALTDQAMQPGKGLKVLVLDAGSLDYPTHIDNLPVNRLGRIIGGHEVRNYEKLDDRTQFGLFPQMNLGGRSVFWSGLIPRMQEWELVNWPRPIRDYLKMGGYAAAEKLMRKHVAAGAYQEMVIRDLHAAFPGFVIVDTPRSSHQPDFGPEGNPEKHPESFLYRSTGTFSAAELLLDSVTDANDPGTGRLFVNCNHLVTKLEWEGNLVTGVVAHDLVGNRDRTFHSQVVVLAAGSLESPKIALTSKLNDPSGKVGYGLTDHPSYYAPNDGKSFPMRDDSPYAGPYRHARIFFYPTEPFENHWFNVEVVINGQYWAARHADDDVLEREYPPDAKSQINFKFVFSSPLQEGNRLDLNGPDGKVRIHVPENPSGRDARDAVVILLSRLMKFFGVDPVDLSKDHNLHFGNGGTVNHAGGTLRMPYGPDEVKQRGVVDENLKFEAYDNLFACDPSVYPYIPAANPSLTLAALARRLADHLVSVVRPKNRQNGRKALQNSAAV